MKNPLKKLAIFQRAEFLSVKDLLQRAGAISVLFLAVHLAGFREFTGVLNGTIGSLALGWNLSAFLAVIYIVFYLAFVILVPILVLAAMILTVWQRCVQKGGSSSLSSNTNFWRNHAAGQDNFHARSNRPLPLFQRCHPGSDRVVLFSHPRRRRYPRLVGPKHPFRRHTPMRMEVAPEFVSPV